MTATPQLKCLRDVALCSFLAAAGQALTSPVGVSMEAMSEPEEFEIHTLKFRS
jgi:hypothetical protein